MKHIEKLATIIEPFTDSRNQQRGFPPTLAPQCDTLLLVSLADTVITVTVHVVAGMAVMQVDIGGAVRAGTSAELWQITRVTGFTALSACWLQLHSASNRHKDKDIYSSIDTCAVSQKVLWREI